MSLFLGGKLKMDGQIPEIQPQALLERAQKIFAERQLAAKRSAPKILGKFFWGSRRRNWIL